MQKEIFEHPLVGRYVSPEMSFLWSPQKKFSTWRKLWLALAESQRELGLNISAEQIEEMKMHLDDIDFAFADAREAELRHDVMAHIHTFGEQCPLAKPIIHLGATSCFVGDNTDLLLIKESLEVLQRKLVSLLETMKGFAQRFRDLPTLGFTHFQPAQLTTVGKRCCMWMQDLVIDYHQLRRLTDDLPMRGVKGTTGTQATFLELFDGDHAKVKELNRRVCEKMGFRKWQAVSGQTYSRKYDFLALSALSGLGQSASKIASDLRLLASIKEIEEPFGESQVGSSAMPYKRNPICAERICSLARYVSALPQVAANTHANQWFERTLDDSAIRRLTLPEGFLVADVLLTLLSRVMGGLHVWPAVIRANIEAELPFMATEMILMRCVKAGGDRQVLHEALRGHAMEAGKRVKEQGLENDLLARIRADPLFESVHAHLADLVDPAKFVGRAPQQVDEFIEEEINTIVE